MNRRALPIAIIAAVLALGSVWLSHESGQEMHQAADRPLVPDYFIDAFTATETGDDGLPTQRLTAIRVDHYPDGRARLVEPHLVVYQDTEPPWHAYAALGELRSDGQRVDLSGGVRLVREEPEPAELVTDTLAVFPKRRFAETPDPLTLTTPQGRLEAVGMEASLAQEQILLKSEVRGVYAP